MDYITEFKNAGLPTFANFDAMISLLRKASLAYYNSDTCILNDVQYDMLKEFIETQDPQHNVLKEIGAPVKHKVTLPYEMWSMNKMKPNTKPLIAWIKKYNHNPDYVISAKLDGVSGLYDSINNKLYTRGDGIEGQDVSYLIPHLKLPKEHVTRGEFIISLQNFEKHFKGKSNPRNTVSGIINKQAVEPEVIKYVDFVPYEVVYPPMYPLDQMKSLYNPVKYQHVISLTNDVLATIYTDWRGSHKYQ